MFSDLSFFSIVILLAAGQGLFLSLALLVAKQGNWRANRYLGLFTLAVVFAMVDVSIDADATEQGTLLLRTLLWPRDFIYGPAIYFYVREITLPNRYTLLPRQWLHFLPALLHAAIFWIMPIFFAAFHNAMLTGEANAQSGSIALIEGVGTVELLTSIIHVFIYLWLAVRLLKPHRERIASTFSYNEHISLNWLRILLMGVVAVYVIWIIEDVLSEFVDMPNGVDDLLGVSMVLLVYAMSFLGLRQPVIFTGQSAMQIAEKQVTAEPDIQKYKTSSLSDDLSQQLLVELQSLMHREKPYLNSQLSLPQLAEQLGVSGNYLSQIVNEQLQQNFFEFINSYRVDEAKLILSDSDRKKDNILNVALDVGFNAKSSFYTAFKKHTGMTPGEYRKRA